MTMLHIQGDWSIIQGRHQQRWAMLAGDDLRSTEGTQNELCLHMTTRGIIDGRRSAARGSEWGEHPIAAGAVRGSTIPR